MRCWWNSTGIVVVRVSQVLIIGLDGCEPVPTAVDVSRYPRSPCSTYCVPDNNENADEEEASESAPDSEAWR